jgi:hypothetical protein
MDKNETWRVRTFIKVQVTESQRMLRLGSVHL